MKNYLYLIICIVLLTACSPQAEATQEVIAPVEPVEEVTEVPVEDPSPTALPEIIEEVEVPDIDRDTSNLVTPSENCIRCHTELADDAGNDVSFDILWQSSMMANAAIDPYWIATVSSEELLQPELADVIEDKCTTCHMPLARFDAVANDESTNMFGGGFLHPDHHLHDLAMDGISCNLCHQIEPDNFDQADSFSGGYFIDDTELEWEGRVSYGPFPVSNGMQNMMMSFSGYLPVQSDHVIDSALCGTCHNLYTPYLDGDGNVVGEFPEQTTYMEWQNSTFEETESCADCHMPLVEGPIRLSTVGRAEQDYLRQHTFTGANAFMTSILNENSTETGVKAESYQLENTISRIEEQMANETGSVQLSSSEIAEGILKAEVLVSNDIGHKFPTGYPSRRAWIYFRVLDADGNLIFESGAVNENGSIAGNDNDSDMMSFEPHYEVITDPAQVQIYEAVLGNTDGEVTTTLLRAAKYIKDNRLPPLGFDPLTASEDIWVFGAASADDNFVGGSDLVKYEIDLFDAPGPFTITVELLYQSIGYRWAENLREVDTEYASDFMGYYDLAENSPLLVDDFELIVGE